MAGEPSSESGRIPAEPGSQGPGAPPGDGLLPLLAGATTNPGRPLDEVVPLLYEEMRRLARRELHREQPGHTLSTTGLVHEAYLELAHLAGIQWKSRAHFFGVCARVMRNVLVDYAVARKAQKRGGGLQALPLDEVQQAAPEAPQEWIDLDEALRRLAQLDERLARVVECRFFAGMSVEESAEALEVSPATVKRDWALARAWLNAELSR